MTAEEKLQKKLKIATDWIRLWVNELECDCGECKICFANAAKEKLEQISAVDVE